MHGELAPGAAGSNGQGSAAVPRLMWCKFQPASGLLVSTVSKPLRPRALLPVH